MKSIIHVNMHAIRRNLKEGTNDPVLTVKTYKSNDYAHEAIIRLPDGTEVGRFIYRVEDPLSCGARVWFETNLEVEVVDHNSLNGLELVTV